MHSAGFSQDQRRRLEAWLSETGELYVQLYPPLRFFHNLALPLPGACFFVRSVADFEELILTELDLRVSQQRSVGLSARAFRRMQYPLRGVVGDDFLGRVLERVPEGEHCFLVSLEHFYPSYPRVVLGLASTHAEIREEFSKCRGQRIGIGSAPGDLLGPDFVPDAEENLEVFYEKRGDRYQLSAG